MARSFTLSLLPAILYFLFLLPLAAVVPIGSSSEAREVHVARVMYESGGYILPERNGLLPSKPPLFHWLTAASGYLTGGVSEINARGISLLFGSLTLLLVGRLAFSFSREGREESALILAVLVLGSSYEFIRLSTDARVDMTFCFFVTLAVSAIYMPLSTLAQKYSIAVVNHRARDFLLFYAACTMAVLTKGPLGIVLPLLICVSGTVFFYGVKTGIGVWLKQREGLYLFLLIAPLWYLLAYKEVGPAILLKQLVFENLTRFQGGVFLKEEPVWFYVPTFIRFAFPWSLLFILFAVFDIFKRGGEPRRFTVWLNYVWFLSGFIFFSLAAGKRHAYLVPLFVPMSIALAAKLLPADLLKLKLFRVLRGVFCLLILFLLIIIGATFYLTSPDIRVAETARWLREGSGFLLGAAGTALLAFIFCSGSKTGQALKTSIALIFSVALVSLVGVAAKNNLKGFKNSAARINAIVPSGEQLIAVRKAEEELTDPLLLYLNRSVQIVHPDNLNHECGKYYLFQDRYKDLLKGRILGVYRQVMDTLKDKHERDIYLVYSDCPRL